MQKTSAWQPGEMKRQRDTERHTYTEEKRKGGRKRDREKSFPEYPLHLNSECKQLSIYNNYKGWV